MITWLEVCLLHKTVDRMGIRVRQNWHIYRRLDEGERKRGRSVHSFMLSYPLSFVRPGTCCASSTGWLSLWWEKDPCSRPSSWAERRTTQTSGEWGCEGVTVSGILLLKHCAFQARRCIFPNLAGAVVYTVIQKSFRTWKLNLSELQKLFQTQFSELKCFWNLEPVQDERAQNSRTVRTQLKILFKTQTLFRVLLFGIQELEKFYSRTWRIQNLFF